MFRTHKTIQSNDLDIKVNGFLFMRDENGTPIVNFQQKIVKHSPDGFEWGYNGSGPADTSLNVLYHATRIAKLIVDIEPLYQIFKRDYISGISREPNSKTVIAFETVVEFLKQNGAKEEE